jgi:dihydrofolate reductase
VVLVALQPSTVCTAFVTSAAAGTARNPLASVALRSRANTTFIGGDLVEEVTKLNDQDGRSILMHGYGPVAKTLMRNGLRDELCLWVHPVALTYRAA